jgi:succinylglutamic semialdehyde dehydrogenase
LYHSAHESSWSFSSSDFTKPPQFWYKKSERFNFFSFSGVSKMQTVKVLGDYIAGKFRRPKGAQHRIISRDPGDCGYRIGSFPSYPEHVEQAILAALKAQDSWRALHWNARADYVRKFSAEIVNRREELKKLIALESGKPLWEAKQDVEAIESLVECEIREGVRVVSPFNVGEVRWGVQGSCRFVPLGVVAVLGAAASPVKLALANILSALLTGNAVVFKPSKLVPACGQFIARMFDEIDLPNGVFAMLQGDVSQGQLLLADKRIDAVLFTGASHSGKHILESCVANPHRMVALQMGGVNPTLVLDDADVKRAVYECVRGAYVSAGQRYTATGVILVSLGVYKAFEEAFVETVNRISVGYSFDPGVFMGPLLSQSACERALDRQDRLLERGAKSLLLSKRLDRPKPGYYLSPSVLAMKNPVAMGDLCPEGQSFGPDVVLVPFSKDEEGVALANSSEHRLAAAVMTEDINRFEKLLPSLRFGWVNHNLATSEISMRLPLTGLGACGNHRPAGVYNQRNCSSPQSVLTDRKAYDAGRNLGNFPAV